MSDPTQNAVNSAENDSKKKRGPRPRYYFCAAIKDKRIIHEAIQAETPEEANDIFLERKGVDAQICDDGSSFEGGGMGYRVAGGINKPNTQRISVSVHPSQLARRTTKAIQAQFKGWTVYGSGLCACEVDGEQYDDNELISIEFGDRIDPASKVKKPMLKKREVIPVEALENVKSL